VEDRAPLRRLMRLALSDEPAYSFLEASGGPAALEIMQVHAPDLVLLDVSLPGGVDGFEVCRRMREQRAPRETAILFVTAQDDPSLATAAVQCGADGVLAKPFRPAQLADAVRTRLRARGSAG
jgi:DNA-binding response OmpR family regulator